MTSEKELVLMNTGRIQRTLKRMVHEIVEKNSANKSVLLFGIDERGHALANVLKDLLVSILDQDVTVIQLAVKNGSPSDAFEKMSVEAESTFIVVVDDVIFSGKTMFDALRKISESLNPSEIHTAVMIDRGHRKFPVKAEFCGMELPTKLNEHVSVIIKAMDPKQVILSNTEK